ncbi:hypothetical protein EDD22DRAFT_1007109, partial [Suillus occidentalis]
RLPSGSPPFTTTSGHLDTFCTRLDTVNDLPAENSSCPRLFFSRYTPIFLLGALQGGGEGTIIYSPHQLFRCPDICIPRYALISILSALQGELGSGTLICSHSYSKSHSRPVSNAQHLISAALSPSAVLSTFTWLTVEIRSARSTRMICCIRHARNAGCNDSIFTDCM